MFSTQVWARRSVAVGLVALLWIPQCAFAYGGLGHQYVGAIADELLTANAKKNVIQLLGMPLRDAATWADCVKGVARAGGKFVYRRGPRSNEGCSAFESARGIAEMEDYVRRNTDNCKRRPGDDDCHRQYHYTDVAIQHDRYDRAYIGTSEHDIVGAIAASIVVLEGKPSPTPFKIKDKREAVLLLAHFVGDIHQPLHVGSIYLDRQGKPVNPDAMGRRFDPATLTRGGNWIAVGGTNLHADWDAIRKSNNALQISKAAMGRARATKMTSGPAQSWAAQWASETVVSSRAAFEGVTFSPSSKKGHWAAHFDDRKAYLKTKNRVQAQELEKAGARLAQILNATWP
jgi:hypothetical protein